MQAFGGPTTSVGRNPLEPRISNVEQGISNDEVKSFLLLTSVFDIRYSIFRGSVFSFYAACGEVTDQDSRTSQTPPGKG
jgi:hypothetical protein